VLEYTVPELLSESISNICHPSDLVPVMRELKEAGSATHAASMASGQSPHGGLQSPDEVSLSGSSNVDSVRDVHLLFRVRRKKSGYTWMDATGRVHVDPGKSRKYVVLVGRERPVYNVNRAAISLSAGGIGDTEFWWKASPQGLCLYCTPDVCDVLGYTAEDIVGIKIVSLAAPAADAPGAPTLPDQVEEVKACLRKAASGEVASLRHFYRNKQGQPVDCFTNFYPNMSTPTPTLPQHVFILCQTNEYQSELRRKAKNEPAFVTREPYPKSPVRRTSGDGDGSGSTSPPARSPPASASPVVTSSSGTRPSNAFEELDTSQSTSWQCVLLLLCISRLKQIQIRTAPAQGGQSADAGGDRRDAGYQAAARPTSGAGSVQCCRRGSTELLGLEVAYFPWTGG
jgi:hypothetical protein